LTENLPIFRSHILRTKVCTKYNNYPLPNAFNVEVRMDFS